MLIAMAASSELFGGSLAALSLEIWGKMERRRRGLNRRK
jgi:hypothetical protein